MRYLNLIKNIENWWLYLAVKFGLNRTEPLLFRARRGITMEVPRRLLQTFKEIFMDECYMRGLAHGMPPSPVIIDVGANAGYFTFYCASRFPEARIVAFEPMPANFRLLDANRRLNPAKSIDCVRMAVMGSPGMVGMSYDPGDSYTTGATVLKGSLGGGDVVQVPGVSLPEVFERWRLGRCDLIKMDCEGAEYDILYNTPRSCLAKIGQIALEVHKGPEPGQSIDALSSYLLKQGFNTRQRPVGMLWAWRR
jgi:FkbM family methyltransferase